MAKKSALSLRRAGGCYEGRRLSRRRRGLPQRLVEIGQEEMTDDSRTGQVMQGQKSFPSFAPQITKTGRWFVAVKTGVGPVSHIADFATEADAMNWISNKSEYWPGGPRNGIQKRLA